MKSHISYLNSLILIIILFCSSITLAQTNDNPKGITPGNLTFTVKTITNNSTYSPRNVIAIWIKDAQGNFVVSRKVMANSQKQHLVKWKANSSGNVVNAITGSTLSSHQTHTITWDGKNASGIDMPDGPYQIWVEYTSTNSNSNGNQGPYLSVDFEKGPAVQHITPANATYYQNIVADWVPLGVGVNDFSKAGANVSIFPNPFRHETTIQVRCEKPSQAYITVYDAAGQKVAILVNDSFNTGVRDFTWEGTSVSGSKLDNGIYFVHIMINGFTKIQKVIINR